MVWRTPKLHTEIFDEGKPLLVGVSGGGLGGKLELVM